MLLSGLIGLVVLGAGAMFVMEICPPAVPWPMPPWCEGGAEVPPPPDIPLLGSTDDY